jgi:signal transduction histidine kinase/tetratricopeptide (TPR) repeat protein
MKKSLFLLSVFITSFYFNTSAKTTNSPIVLDSVFISVDRKIENKEYHDAFALIDSFIKREHQKVSIDFRALSQAFFKKGECYSSIGEYQKSIPQILESIKYSEKGNDSIFQAIGYRELGYNYAIIGKYNEALEAYQKALKFDQAHNDWENVSVDLNAIGKIYELWRQFDKALDFYNQSLQIALEQKNLYQVTVRMAGIASVYKSLKQYDTALEWLKKALDIEIELGNEVQRGYRLDQIGEIYTMMGDYIQAEEYLKQALEIFEVNHIQLSKSIVQNHLAANYLLKKDTQKAAYYYNESLAIAQRIGFSNMILKNYQELSILYEQTGDHVNALKHYKRFFFLKDSIYNEKAQSQLMEFQAKYETEQKEKELAIMNQEKLAQELELNRANQQKVLMIGISLVLLILLASLYSRFVMKKRTQAELTAINSKLNELNTTKDKLFSILAHDLRNSMWAFSNITESLSSNFGRISQTELKDYLGELSHSASSVKDLLKNILDWAKSQQDAVKVNKKIVNISELVNQSINHVFYTALQKDVEVINRIENGLTISTDEDILYTILRNLINNAVKYSSIGGKVYVDAIQNNDQFSIKITDNGIGMKPEQYEKIFDLTSCNPSPGTQGEKGSGLGLVLSNELLIRLGGSISIESELNKGSCFTVTLPVVFQY